MRIGLIKETKPAERRVGLTTAGVAALASDGHHVLVDSGAGLGTGTDDAAYERAGATVVGTDQAWSAELVIKVKEPVASEYGYLRQGSVLFTYLHLAADLGPDQRAARRQGHRHRLRDSRGFPYAGAT